MSLNVTKWTLQVGFGTGPLCVRAQGLRRPSVTDAKRLRDIPWPTQRSLTSNRCVLRPAQPTANQRHVACSARCRRRFARAC